METQDDSEAASPSLGEARAAAEASAGRGAGQGLPGHQLPKESESQKLGARPGALSGTTLSEGNLARWPGGRTRPAG